MNLTNTLKLLAIAPKPPAAISFICSVIIIVKVLRSKRRRSRVYHRIMCAMSFNAVIMSICYFWGSWAIPQYSNLPVYQASGNIGTCSFQGFLIMFSVTNANTYYMSLPLVSYVQIRNQFKATILRKTEILLHCLTFLFSLSLGVVAIATDNINPAGAANCWLNTFPNKCLSTPNVDCIRGSDVTITIFYVVLLYYTMCFVLAVFFIIKIYILIKGMEKSVENSKGKKKIFEHARKNKSSIIAKQCLLYLAAYLITIFFSALSRFIEILSGELNMTLHALGLIFINLTGAKNLIIYLVLTPKKNVLEKLHNSSESRTKKVSIRSNKKSTTIESTTMRSLTLSKESISSLDSVVEDARNVQPISERRLSCPAMMERYEFNIFDGTNPSEQWAEYFEDDIEESVPGEDETIDHIMASKYVENIVETISADSV
mmetsp:Transcript_14291/g.20402  ORF Transcript_14291/g.20402 Transcript_14291/m.20402 type:complete len:430 (-) Transcript_14291:236-1525(-)